MTKADIEDAICDIMMKDGPDGHVDGAEIIAEFVHALLEGNGEKWIEAYRINDDEHPLD
jgi:hypothetical protein